MEGWPTQPSSKDSANTSTTQDRPRSALRTFLTIFLGMMSIGVLIAGVIGIGFAISNVSGLGRLLVAIAIGLGVLWFGVGYFRQLGNPPPPDPGPMAVDPGLQLAYECEMCGLELALVKAGKEKAPRHCGEKMVLVRLED